MPSFITISNVQNYKSKIKKFKFSICKIDSFNLQKSKTLYKNKKRYNKQIKKRLIDGKNKHRT